jgi:hypothetical protein
MSTFDTTTPEIPAGNTEGVVAPETTPLDPMAVEVIGDPPAAPPAEAAPAPQYLDIDQFGDYLVKVKIDGSEQELPFSKVRDGLMMQEAFTRRTQELAEERRALRQADALVAALDRDPAATIQQLSEVYDLDPASGFQPVERTPEEIQFRQQQAQLAAQQQQLNRQRIEAEIATLKSQYGDLDVQATARYASENGLTLTAAYKAMEFDRLREQQAQQAQQEQARARALAAQSVHSGAGTQRGAVGATPPKITSVRDAWMAAKAQKK